MALMVSVSGIRGIFGEDLVPTVLIKYICAFIQLLEKNNGKIILGRDTRKSGPAIERIVEGTLLSLGFDVLNIGVSTTPTVLYCTKKLGCDGGIIITASHNPQQWNALKLCNDKGLFLFEEDIAFIKNYVNNNQELNIKWKDYKNLGNIIYQKNSYQLHIKEVLKHIDTESIKKRRFRVAIDPAAGAASTIARCFLETLGCRVEGIFETPSEDFPRGPEPVPENLDQLCSLVKVSGSDIGFAFDPDGDRLSIVSDKGIAIGEEYTLVLAGEAFLKKHKTDVVCNLSTSRMIDDLAQRYGINVYRTKIGEINVTRKLLEKKIFFGGEGNGGVIVPSINPCRDSITAMGLILELLSSSNKSISDIIIEFPSYVMQKCKFEIECVNKEKLYSRLYEELKTIFSKHQINNLDGIKIYNNKEWIHIRFSNTEPVVRIITESPCKERSEKLLAMGKQIIYKACKQE